MMVKAIETINVEMARKAIAAEKVRLGGISRQSAGLLSKRESKIMLCIVCFFNDQVRGTVLKLTSTGPGCSKLTTSLINVSLKFQTLISEICQYFLLKKCEKLSKCKSFFHFFKQKISVYLVIKS